MLAAVSICIPSVHSPHSDPWKTLIWSCLKITSNGFRLPFKIVSNLLSMAYQVPHDVTLVIIYLLQTFQPHWSFLFSSKPCPYSLQAFPLITCFFSLITCLVSSQSSALATYCILRVTQSNLSKCYSWNLTCIEKVSLCWSLLWPAMRN